MTTRSVLEPFGTARLTFTVGDRILRDGLGEVIVDPQTGNPRRETDTIEVKATLSPKRDPQLREQYGIDVKAVFLSGYCGEPAVLPRTIKPLMQADAVIDDREGIFTLLPWVTNPYMKTLNLEQIPGTKIAGYFEIKGGR